MATRQRPRRAKGTGTINERPDGRFNCAITVRTLLGPRRFTTTANSYRDGERWIAGIRRDYERTGLSPEGRSMTVSDYYPLWLASIEGTVAPKTHSEYSDKFRLHIAPRHGRIKLTELTTPHVNALYKDMAAGGASPRLVQSVHAAYRKALRDAEGWDLVRKNAAAFARVPRQEAPERPVMGREEAARFLEEIRWRPPGGPLPARRHDGPEALRAARDPVGGPRPGEGDAEGQGHEDEIVPQAGRPARGGPPAPQEGPGRGEAPGGARLARARHGLPDHDRHPQRGDNVLARSLKPVMARAGLPTEKCFQYLRRSAATFLVMLRVHPRDVMRWMGHSNIQTTMNVYAQAPDELQEETARLMGEMLFGAGSPSGASGKD